MTLAHYFLKASNMTRNQVILSGIGMFLIGIVLVGLSVALSSSMVQRREKSQQQMQIHLKACEKRLKSFGMQIIESEGGFEIQSPGLDNAIYKLGQASVVASVCTGWIMTDFCMGEGCQKPNSIWMRIEPNKKLQKLVDKKK